MQNFIWNIIDRLRSFIYGDTRNRTIGESVVDNTISVIEERAPEIVPGSFDTVALTPAGILFKGIRYDSPALREMLLYRGSGDRARVMIKDPSDASSIYVWNGTARPQPQWVTVAAAGVAAGQRLSFAHHAAVREFAKAQNLDFSTEEQRLEAHCLLRQHWEMLAGQKPSRESRQATRGHASPAGQSANAAGNEPPGTTEFAPDPVGTDNKPPKGRRPSKAAVAKGQRAKARKKGEDATTKPRLPDTESK